MWDEIKEKLMLTYISSLEEAYQKLKYLEKKNMRI